MVHYVWNYTTAFNLPLLFFLLIYYNRNSQTTRERVILMVPARIQNVKHTRIKTLLFTTLGLASQLATATTMTS